MIDHAKLLSGAVPLQPDHFTARSKTPWGGTFIGKHFKEALCPENIGTIIGESWEFSCDPSAPSLVMGTALPLATLIPSCEILVKIINARENLSVQVHPHDTDSFLKSNECGKPESWLILHAEPGAGIYLGFRPNVSKQILMDLLLTSADLEGILNFIPVKAGDYFEIPAGVCHAVGAGVTLLEPQRVLPENDVLIDYHVKFLTAF